MNQKKYLVTRVFLYPIILLFTFLASIEVMSYRVVGLLIVLVYMYDILKSIKLKSLFSPFLFSNIFMVSYGLYEIGLSLQISGINLEAKLLIILCMFIWDLVSTFNKWNFKIKEERTIHYDLNLEKLKRVVYILFFIASICMLYEWYVFGGIPALSENLELERFNISVNPLLHILAIMHRIIIVLAFVILMKQKKNIYIISVIIVSVGFLMGLGARAEILYPVLMATIILYFSNHISRKTIISIGVFAVIIIGIYPFIRNYISFGEDYISNLIRVSRFKGMFFFTPLYESFAYNFEVFGLNFESFPEILPFGKGSYTIFSNIPFLDFGRSITEDQNMLLGNNFYAGLASTYLGSVYADYGFMGSIIYTGLLSFIINKIFKSFTKNRKISTLIIYSYIYYGTLMGFYHYVFDIVFIFYLLIILIVIILTKRRGIKE